MFQHSSILLLFTLVLHGVQSQTVPSVDIPLTSYTTTEGTTYNIPCSVSSTTAITNVFWQRTINGQPSTITIDGVNFSGATTGSPSLNIITASISDSGTYTCFASNSAGTGSDSTQLIVSGTIPSVDIPLTSYTTNDGTTYTIPCSVSSTTTVTNVFWQRTINGQTSTINIDGVNFFGATIGSPSLNIITASTTDSGTYTCFASNSAGTGSDSTQLTISGNVPTVNVGQSSYSVTAGSSITLTCTVSANPTHTNVFWQRDVGSGSQAITIDGVNYSGSQVNAPSLTIIVSQPGDAGTYTCSAVNSVGTGQSSTTLTVTGSVPAVQIQQAVYTATTGTSITLVCTVTANPTHTSVFWQRNVGSGTQSINIDGINYSGSAVNSPSLTVLNVDPADSGTYTCFATNAVGQGNSQATTLSVSGSLPVVTIAQPSYSVVTGQSVTLGCTVSASPTHSNVFWQRIDNGVANTISIDGVKYSGSTVNTPSLTITNAGSNDNTVYTCSATNAVGTGTSGQTSLSVTGSLPVVTIAQQSYSVVTGQSVTLGCTVSASPTHSNVFWQRIDNGVANTISIDGSKYSGSTVNTPSLTITNAGSNDNTVYTCSATNAVGTGTSGQTTLSVTGSVPAVTISQTGYSTITGNSITLGCTVSADPTHTSVFWQLNINGITQNITIDGVNYSGSTVNSPSLVVLHANTGDSGSYTCFATNSVGTGQSSQTTLTVTGNWCIYED